MTSILWLVAGYLLVVATWALYLAVMNLKAHLHELGPVAKAHGYMLVAVAVAFDVLVNVTIGTLIFLDRPREWLLTARLKRYVGAERATWRTALAKWICHHLLNQFDPSGKHC